MKTKNLLFGAAIVLVGFTACKNEAEEKSERTVTTYTTYVDSLGNVESSEARANWEAIEADYQRRTAEAEAALENMKDREAAQERINASKAKYEEMRAKYQAEMEAEAAKTATTAGSGNMKLRSSFFGTNMGADMNFDWVNKDNIVRVYNDFYNEFDKNQKNYSREDLDEIKTMYEALDARKNTVEKEGLSSSDNNKLAEIKRKFAPKFKWERMTSKGDENQDAKEEAN